MTPSSDNPTPDRVLSLDVIVNGAKTGTWLLVVEIVGVLAPGPKFQS